MRETKKISWSKVETRLEKIRFEQKRKPFVYLQQYNIQKNDLPESGVW